MSDLFRILMIAAATVSMAGTLTGRIENQSEDGLGQVSLILYDSITNCAMAFGESDESGQYRVENIPDGSYKILLSGPTVLMRYVGNTDLMDINSADNVSVLGSKTLDITAQTGAQISGRISVNGGSISQSSIHLLDPITFLAVSQTIPNSDGSYLFAAVEPGCYIIQLDVGTGVETQSGPYVFYPHLLSRSDAQAISIQNGAHATDIDIAADMTEFGSFTVTFVGPNGLPQNDASITFTGSDGLIYDAELRFGVPTTLFVNPDEHDLHVHFEDTYVDMTQSNNRINAGNNQALTLTGSAGSSITGNINGISFTPLLVEALPVGDTSPRARRRVQVLPGGYQLSGLEAGTYVVRFRGQSIGGFQIENIQQIYFPDAIGQTGAETISLSSSDVRADVSFTIKEGASLSGIVRYLNDAIPFAPLFSVVAYETGSQESFQGLLLGSLAGFGPGEYNISGLPPGEYKLGSSNVAFADSFFGLNGLQFGSPLACNFLPEFYQNTQSFNQAETILVLERTEATGFDLTMDLGGAIHGRIISSDCQCPIQGMPLGLFDGNDLVALSASFFGGFFTFNGLPSGAYTLRTTTLDPAIDQLDETVVVDSLEHLFTGSNGLTNPTTIRVTQGSSSQLAEWCIDIDANVGTGGNGNTKELYYSFTQTDSSWQTQIGTINPRNASVDATFTAYASSGSQLGAVDRTLPAYGRILEDVDVLFGRNDVAMVIVTSAQSLVGFSNSVDPARTQSFAVPAADDLFETLYVPHVAESDAFWTIGRLANGSDESVNPVFRTSGTNTRTISLSAPYSSVAVDYKGDFFSQPIPSGTGWGIFLDSEDALAGVEVFGQSPTFSNAAALGLSSFLSTTVIMPHIPGNKDVWWSGLVLVNANQTDAQVTARVFDANGNEIANSTFTLAANSKRADVMEGFFPGTDVSAGQWVQFESSQAITGYELFGTWDRNGALAGLEPPAGGATQQALPYVHSIGSERWSGSGILNTGSVLANVTFTMYADSGQRLDARTIAIGPNAKSVDFIDGLLNIGSDGGWILVDSDQEVIVFELFGENGNSMVSGINALRW